MNDDSLKKHWDNEQSDNIHTASFTNYEGKKRDAIQMTIWQKLLQMVNCADTYDLKKYKRKCYQKPGLALND